MGKVARWFRALLGFKKTSDSLPASGELECRPTKEKKKWGILSSFNGHVGGIGGPRGSSAQANSSDAYVEVLDANKHAIAVAAATAAVAEAALAAAQAAAEVVRLTSSGNRASASGGGDRRRELAAVKIQSAFRAYLARRALRALKGLVRLQALVRGHIVRKQSADMLRRMQAMARIQARASANRGHVSESIYSSTKFSQSHQHPGFTTHKGNAHSLRAYNTKLDGPAVLKRCGSTSNINDIIDLERMHLNSNRLESWMEERSWNSHRDTLLKIGRADDEKSDKILEVDTWKPHLNHQRNKATFQTSNNDSAWNYKDPGFPALNSLSGRLTKSQKPYPNFSSGEALSSGSLKFPTDQAEEIALWAAEDSPQVHSALSRSGSSARRGPFTPTRSECSRSIFSGYTSHPNYMANTESSRAKFRSQSAPRQRIQLEKLSSTKRFVRGFWDSDTHSERGFDLHASFRTRAYPGSGRLD